MATTSQDYQGAKSTSNGGSTKDVRDDMDALRSDIASLANSVSKLAGEKLGTVVSDAEAMAGQKLGDVETMIRKNPTQSALIAVGVGFLFGLVLTR
jgi:ElaB/YqjD/DUF883 family membrane-anchored ribosome-binding protein